MEGKELVKSLKKVSALLGAVEVKCDILEGLRSATGGVFAVMGDYSIQFTFGRYRQEENQVRATLYPTGMQTSIGSINFSITKGVDRIVGDIRKRLIESNQEGLKKRLLEMQKAKQREESHENLMREIEKQMPGLTQKQRGNRYNLSSFVGGTMDYHADDFIRIDLLITSRAKLLTVLRLLHEESKSQK